MSKQYKALKPLGRWVKGEIVGDLPELQIKQLLKDKIIEEVKVVATKQVKQTKQNIGENKDVE